MILSNAYVQLEAKKLIEHDFFLLAGGEGGNVSAPGLFKIKQNEHCFPHKWNCQYFKHHT